MALFLLQPRKDLPDPNPWTNPYDKTHGLIVRAGTEGYARWLVANPRRPELCQYGDEGPDCWLDPTLTTCHELAVEGDPAVIMQSFMPG